MYARPSSRGAFSLQRAPPSRARPASLHFAGGFALFPPSRRGLLPTGTTSGTSSAGGRPRLVYRGLPKHPWCHHSRRVPRRFGFQAGVFQHAWASAPGSHPPNPPVSPGGLRCKRSLHCKPRHKKKLARGSLSRRLRALYAVRRFRSSSVLTSNHGQLRAAPSLQLAGCAVQDRPCSLRCAVRTFTRHATRAALFFPSPFSVVVIFVL